MNQKNKEIKFIFAGITILFLIFLIGPVLGLLVKSFIQDGTEGLTLANYMEVLTSKGFLQALGNSFLISTVSAVLTTFLAFILAYTVHYTNAHPEI